MKISLLFRTILANLFHIGIGAGHGQTDLEEVPSSSLDSDYRFNYITVAEKIRRHITDSVDALSFQSVQDGEFYFFQTTDCIDVIRESSPFGYSSNCWVQNPDSPYGLIMLPPHVNETLDEFWGFPVSDSGRSATWKLEETEAIVVVGETPPACRYFSFTNYLYSRHMPLDFEPASTVSLSPTCLPGNISSRCEFFASLSDSVNDARGIRLGEDGENTKAGVPFALVLSASERAMAAAATVIAESGVPASHTTLFPYPGQALNLGHDVNADTFVTILRTAYYENQTEADLYFDSNPLQVLRLSELVSHSSEEPLYPRAELIPRETGWTDGSSAGLSRAAMQNATNNFGLEAIDVLIADNGGGTLEDWEVSISPMVSVEPDNGFDCIDDAHRCLADCRDTIYPFTSHTYRREENCVKLAKFCEMNERKKPHPFCLNTTEIAGCRTDQRGVLLNETGDVILVVGVNHAKANMSAYSSLSVYDQPTLWGVLAVNGDDMDGTAYQYTTGVGEADRDENLQQALPYLYAYQFKRSCGTVDKKRGCLEIPFLPTEENGGLFIPLHHPMVFAERMYNNPATHVGPSTDEVVHSLQIHLKKKIKS